MAKIHKHSFKRLFVPRYLATWPLFLTIWLASKLPHKNLISLGKNLGKLACHAFPKRRYIIKTNLSLCFPEKSPAQIDELVKKNIEFLAIGACETALAWFGPEKNINKIQDKLTINNEHILQQALADSRPLILITPHASSQELLSKLFVRKYNYRPVFRHLNNPVANYMMQYARLKIYKNPILKEDIRQIVKSLQQKVTVGLLPDQDFGRRRSVFVPFFGVMAATSTLLSKYKRLTNAQVLALSYVRDENDLSKFTIEISEPLNITGYDLEHDARELNRVLEEIINRDISMYFWAARKFRTRPLGEDKIYNYEEYKLKTKYKTQTELYDADII